MIYLVYKMHLKERARRNLGEFWKWLEEREEWFYEDLPMVKDSRWYYSVVGDVYTIESWTSFDNEAGFGEYRQALSTLKADDGWESTRVSQDDWWDFLETRLVTDPPGNIGFARQDSPASGD